jgi:hypothetical protein
MKYYEFVCVGRPLLSVATADPDPAHIPAAALACCVRWEFSRPFNLGDGSHVPAVDAAIQVRVAGEGYHIFFSRTATEFANVTARRTRNPISN